MRVEFNPKKKRLLLIKEIMDPIFESKDMGQTDAKAYLLEYAKYIQFHAPEITFDFALKQAKENIGYYAGYFSQSIRMKIEKLFDATHPILGSAYMDNPPTQEEIFECGLRFKENMTVQKLREERVLKSKEVEIES